MCSLEKDTGSFIKSTKVENEHWIGGCVVLTTVCSCTDATIKLVRLADKARAAKRHEERINVALVHISTCQSAASSITVWWKDENGPSSILLVSLFLPAHSTWIIYVPVSQQIYPYNHIKRDNMTKAWTCKCSEVSCSTREGSQPNQAVADAAWADDE